MKVPKGYVLSKCCKAYSDPKSKVCSRCGAPLKVEYTSVEAKVARSLEQLGFEVQGFNAKPKPPFVMPTCPTSGKPVNKCRCDDCPIPF